MLYFSQQKYFPTLEEAKQQIAVLEFKENFPKEGLHWEYKDLVQFKEFVEDHLTNYLLQSFKDRKNNLSQFSPNNNEIEIPPYYREKYRKPVSYTHCDYDKRTFR